jgi:hypothetical protein
MRVLVDRALVAWCYKQEVRDVSRPYPLEGKSEHESHHTRRER